MLGAGTIINPIINVVTKLQRCIDAATDGPNPAQGAERCVNRFGP